MSKITLKPLIDIWRYRLSLNVERELEGAVGPCSGLSYTDVISKLNSMALSSGGRLSKAVLLAAEKSGCAEPAVPVTLPTPVVQETPKQSQPVDREPAKRLSKRPG